MGRKPSIAPVLVLAVAALPLATGTATAEFEIPQVDVEQIEIEYRGAQHWGLPSALSGDDVEALRQSHELEMQYGVTDWWAVRATPNLEQPDNESLELTAIGLESQFVVIPRRGAFGLAFVGGYSPNSFFADLDAADELEIGPIVELAHGPLLVTLNPNLFREVGSDSEQDGFGLEYASQAEFRAGRRWSVAALMFGEIEDLSRAGGFNEQAHILGPGAYLYSAGRGRTEESEDGEGWSWSLGVGALFGLTEASADTTLRVTFAFER